jgi:hypothetical protein
MLTIGQSPRPDLVDPLRPFLPRGTLLEAGALDDLTLADLPDPATAAYPLVTRLRSGQTVAVDEAVLAPHLQTALNRLEDQGVQATLLLCAGTFDALHGTQPLYKPFPLAAALLRALGIHTPGILAPFRDQVPATQARWQAVGFAPLVWAAAYPLADPRSAAWLRDLLGATPAQCLVLDYVGHDPAYVRALQAGLPVPVLDLGLTAAAALTATFAPG